VSEDKENVSKQVNLSHSKSKFDSQDNDCNKTQIITTKPLLIEKANSQSKSKKRSFGEIVGTSKS